MSINTGMDKQGVVYVCTMEYYSVIKRNKTVLFAEIWIDLEIIIQSEVSQKEKNNFHILMHVCEI